jgi:hypothetical protein
VKDGQSALQRFRASALRFLAGHVPSLSLVGAKYQTEDAFSRGDAGKSLVPSD